MFVFILVQSFSLLLSASPIFGQHQPLKAFNFLLQIWFLASFFSQSHLFPKKYPKISPSLKGWKTCEQVLVQCTHFTRNTKITPGTPFLAGIYDKTEWQVTYTGLPTGTKILVILVGTGQNSKPWLDEFKMLSGLTAIARKSEVICGSTRWFAQPNVMC